MVETTVKTEFDSLRDELSQMRADLASLSKTIGELTTLGVAEGLSDLQKAGKTVQRKVSKVIEDADALRQTGMTAIEEQISARPLSTVALAFGVGLLLGKLLDRK